ncbi:Pumilio y domain member 6 [Linderina macrospora]|uniref:Pumilio y domain member 6 n=1 Tax=Linderina macrospora TaxID=4868 RepID=A0ACC1JGU7_9FUNG|nr:Pumilio y domain member 6 [Linderina macrospora]
MAKQESNAKPKYAKKGNTGQADGGKRKAAPTTTPQESRQQQKKQRKERVLAQPSGELKLAARKIWEVLRQKELDDAVRKQKMVEMMALITGHIKEITFKHDMSRVLQTCIKYGTAAQRDLIAQELSGTFVDLSKSMYGRHILLRLLKFSNKFRSKIIESFYGHVRRLVRHKEASAVIEECYSTYANATQRWHMVAEFYGTEFAVFKHTDKDVRSLDAVLEKNPLKKESALTALKGALLPLLEKGTANHSIVHRALLDYIRHADPKQRSEVIETMRELVVEILHTRDGAHAGMLCLLYGTAKDRKAIVKSFKPYVDRIAREEYGHAVLIEALDCVDDTVFVNKTIMPELCALANDLVSDKWGRRVLLYVLAGRSPLYVGSDALAIMRDGDAVRAQTSKKDPQARRRELAGPVSEKMLAWVAAHVDVAIFDPLPSQAVSETLLRALGDKQKAWEAVLQLVRREVTENHVLVNPIANRVVTNCIIAEHSQPKSSADDSLMELPETNPKFGSDVLDALVGADQLVGAAVAGAFPVRALLESPVTGPKTKKLLAPAKKQIEAAMAAADKKRVYEGILSNL